MNTDPVKDIMLQFITGKKLLLLKIITVLTPGERQYNINSTVNFNNHFKNWCNTITRP